MIGLLQGAGLLSGNVFFDLLLLLPVVILGSISLIYVVVDAIRNFRDRHGYQ